MPLLTTGAGKYPVVSAGGYVGPGDIAGFSGALAWWGLRGYNAAYAGPCIDIVDNAINFLTTINIVNNRLDMAAIAAWSAAHGGSPAQVQQWYDQTGNGRHINKAAGATATVTANAIGGSLPTLRFIVNHGDWLKNATGVTQALPLFISLVSSRLAAGAGSANDVFASNSAGFRAGYPTGANTFYQDSGATASATDNVFHAVQLRYASGASNSNIMVDGVSTTTTATATLSGVFSVGGNTFAATLDGDVCEVGLWAGNIDNAHETSMNSNQHGTNGYNF